MLHPAFFLAHSSCMCDQGCPSPCIEVRLHPAAHVGELPRAPALIPPSPAQASMGKPSQAAYEICKMCMSAQTPKSHIMLSCLVADRRQAGIYPQESLAERVFSAQETIDTGTTQLYTATSRHTAPLPPRTRCHVPDPIYTLDCSGRYHESCHKLAIPPYISFTRLKHVYCCRSCSSTL